MGNKGKGILYGVGVGPGDPQLLTFKAVDMITHCDLLCYIESTAGHSTARHIVSPYINPHQNELPIIYSMSKNRQLINQVYDEVAIKIGEFLDLGKTVVVLCEGDPFFYGSFIHIYRRLVSHYQIKVVPGISSVQAVAAEVGQPLCELSETMAILSARNSDDQISEALATYDCVALLKAGRERQRLIQLIKSNQREKGAVYIENATRDNQIIYHDIDEIPNTPGPYFSMFLCK